MPDLPPSLLDLATDLQVNRHLLRELRRTAQCPVFPHLPPRIQDRHRAYTTRHEATEADLRRAHARFPDPGLLEALVGFLERQGELVVDLPAARHLRTLKGVLGRYHPE